MTKHEKTVPPEWYPFTAEIDWQRSSRSGEVVLGGPFSRPHLSVGYLQAARIILASSSERVPDLLPPVLYLLRHSVELAFKDLLSANHENMVTQARIDYYDGKVVTSSIAMPRWVTEIKQCHKLTTILGWLQEDLPDLVTSAWEAVVAHIDRYEKGSPEWARYDEIRDPADKKKFIKSFQEPRIVEIERLLTDVEEFSKEAAQIQAMSHSIEERSALHDLCLVAQNLTDQLSERGLL